MSWIKKTLQTEAKQTRQRVDKWETGIVCSTLDETIPPFVIRDFEVANVITDGILKIYTVMDKAQKAKMLRKEVWYYEQEECVGIIKQIFMNKFKNLSEFQSWTSLSGHLPEYNNHKVSVEEKSLDSSDGSVIEETPRQCQKPQIPDEDCIMIAESPKSDVDTSDTEEILPVNGDDEDDKQYLDDWSWTMGQENAELESYSDNNNHFSNNARIAMQHHGFFCVNYLPNASITVGEKVKRKQIHAIEETKESKQLKSSDDSDRPPPPPPQPTKTTTTQHKTCSGLKSSGSLKEQEDDVVITSLPKSLGSTQSPIPCYQPRKPMDNISCSLSTKNSLNDANNNTNSSSNSNNVQSKNIYSLQVEHYKSQIMKYLYQTFKGGTVTEITDKSSHQGGDIRGACSTGHLKSTSELPLHKNTTTTTIPPLVTKATSTHHPLPNTPWKNEDIQSTASFQPKSENVTNQSIYNLRVTNQQMKTIERHLYQSFTNGLADLITTVPQQLNGLTCAGSGGGQSRDSQRRRRRPMTTHNNITHENTFRTRSRFGADYQLIKTSRESSSGSDNWYRATPLSISSTSIPCWQPRQTVTRTGGGGGGHHQSSLSSISNNYIASSNGENATTDSTSTSQRKNLYHLQPNSDQMAIIMKHLYQKTS